MRPLELWAGPECTVNRVGDAFRDQLEETGFAQRLDDIDRISSLGIRRMRFPLLWERLAAHPDAQAQWRWADRRIQRMSELGVACIAGLLHHGSGPARTHLLDPAFAAGVADHAQRVAERYPHIDAYTPVNEPLTTARFSGLYGLWYPHRADDRAFVRALLHQVQAIVLAMRRIRQVNPKAQLVQTDDLGLTSSGPRLQYQARFENARRWLAFDLLCGRVDQHHGLWRYLLHHGAAAAELMALVDSPCPPDLIGLNYYVTSQRFLDDRYQLYPESMHGGNGRHRYVDLETVRVHGPLLDGVEARLLETWDRYAIPVAITEAHLSCTREEQMRWLLNAWESAKRARQACADVRAVTAWASFGTMDWDSLVTRREGRYEPGLWDIRAPLPRPTALARMAAQMATGLTPDHPVLEGPGWWQRSTRHAYPAMGSRQSLPVRGRPVLIAGASGTLGRAFARLCHKRGLPYRLLARAEMDIANRHSVQAAMAICKPWALVNAAGFVRIDDAQSDTRHWRENVSGPALLAQVCEANNVRLLTFSSDQVFDGTKIGPYVESDPPCPVNAYGEGKAEAERCVAIANPSALVVRSAAFFGPWDLHNFLTVGLGLLRQTRPWHAVADQVVSPSYVCDLITASLDLLIDDEQGLWHLANDGGLSWFEFAVMAARAAGLDASGIRPVTGRSLGQTAARPPCVVLGSERGQIMPPLADALARYLRECEPDLMPVLEKEPSGDMLVAS